MSKMYRVRFTKDVYARVNSEQEAISEAVKIREITEYDDTVEVITVK